MRATHRWCACAALRVAVVCQRRNRRRQRGDASDLWICAASQWVVPGETAFAREDLRDSFTVAGRPQDLALDWLHECALKCRVCRVLSSDLSYVSSSRRCCTSAGGPVSITSAAFNATKATHPPFARSAR